MTLAQSGAEAIIAQFGENVEIYPQSGQEPENPSDPIYFSDTNNTSTATEYKVRLYTSASDEMLEDYGLEDETESMMYSTSDIANEGDRVVYSPTNQKWTVKSINTNQIGNGPYIWVYGMMNI